MMDQQGALIGGMVACLNRDADIRAILGDPVRIWDHPPRAAGFPHVQIGRCDSRSLEAEGGAVEHWLALTCVSRFTGMEEARAVAGAVEAALAGLALDVGVLVSCAVQGIEVSRSSDRARAWAVMRLRVVTEPGAPEPA